MAFALAIPLLFFAASLFAGCYYSPVGQWTTEDQKTAEHYFRSVRASNEYLRIIKSGNPRRKFTYEERMGMRKEMEIAASEARKVMDNPAFLDKMHPEMRWHFREEYLEALEMTLKNFDFPNYDLARRSDNLYNTFIIWYQLHRDEMKLPVGK